MSLRWQTLSISNIRHILYRNDVYVATGGGQVYRSTNGVDWVNTNAPSYANDKVMYVNGLFFIGAVSGRLMYSATGQNWAIVDTMLGTNAWVEHIIYTSTQFGNMYVVSGRGSGAYVSVSANLSTWAKTGWVIDDGAIGLIQGNGTTIAVGTYGGIGQSTDIITWYSRDTGLDTAYKAYFNGSEFIVYGRIGTSEKMARSTDGINWTVYSFPFSWDSWDYSLIKRVNDTYFLAGYLSTSISNRVKFAKSSDGINWTEIIVNIYSNTNRVVDIEYDTEKNRYIMLQYYTLAYSSNGADWNSFGRILDSNTRDLGIGLDGYLVSYYDSSDPVAYCDGTNYVDYIDLDASIINFNTVGQTQVLTAYVSPDDADDTSITWTSTDPAICTVTPTGDFTAVVEYVGDGTATIRATANGSYNQEEYSECVVNPPGSAYVKQNGIWKPASALVKANGIWSPAIPLVKSSGIWKITL